MEIQKGNHCKYQIRYHIVWKVKYSREILHGGRTKYLKKIIEEIGGRYEYKIEAVGTDENHMHVFVGAHPQISPAQVAQRLKSISAREMFKKYPEIRKYLWGGAMWAIGYYIRTVSDGPLDKVIKKYVEEQGKEYKGKEGNYQLRLVP